MTVSIGTGRGEFLGTPVSDEVSYFSRFTVKFIEIVAAGLATAVSGYLIAQLGGFLSSPARAPASTPTAVTAAPAPAANSTSASQPAQLGQAARPVQPVRSPPPAPPASATANEQRPAPAPEVNPPAKPPAHTTVTATQAAPARKHVTTETSAAESKPRDAAEKPRDAAETKPRDWESVEARVRAALANANANRPALPDAALHHADSPPTPPTPPAAAVQPQPPNEPPATGAIQAGPRAANLQPQPEPPTPATPDPLPAVEIKSRPVAAVEALPPQPAPAAAGDAQAQDMDLVSAIKKIPEMLRNDKPVPASEAPRPPMPVGE